MKAIITYKHGWWRTFAKAPKTEVICRKSIQILSLILKSNRVLAKLKTNVTRARRFAKGTVVFCIVNITLAINLTNV